MCACVCVNLDSIGVSQPSATEYDPEDGGIKSEKG